LFDGTMGEVLEWTGNCLPELWYRYMTETDNYHGGTFTRWIAALSAATCNVRVNIIIAYDLLVGLAVCYHNLRSYGKLSTCHLAQR